MGRPDVKRVGLSKPTSESKTCPHGGCVYDTVGQDFSGLDALDEVIAADVLDAWYPPAPPPVYSKILITTLHGMLELRHRCMPMACERSFRKIVASSRPKLS